MGGVRVMVGIGDILMDGFLPCCSWGTDLGSRVEDLVRRWSGGWLVGLMGGGMGDCICRRKGQ